MPKLLSGPQCPNCGSKLDPEEIKANECWICQATLKSEYDAEINDETED